MLPTATKCVDKRLVLMQAMSNFVRKEIEGSLRLMIAMIADFGAKPATVKASNKK